MANIKPSEAAAPKPLLNDKGKDAVEKTGKVAGALVNVIKKKLTT